MQQSAKEQMTRKLQGIRGMNDILAAEAPLWHGIEATIRDVLSAYGYTEIRIPLVEYTELFSRCIGEVTDIVEKEMYTFLDRNGESLTLRPEATAGCVRACIEHGLLHNQIQRLWCGGPMFRYEKPQKGRYRQFHQIDVEAFGLEGPDIDAELICMTARLWRALGLTGVTLQINSLGSSAARAAYRDKLVAYLEARRDALDEDSRRRLHSNPLRILDTKNPAMGDVVAEAPRLLEHLDEDSRAHFEGLKGFLALSGIPYEINPLLVRGLDYYNKTVFEWVTEQLGTQGTVCGGGRYDGLVAHLGGGRLVPGVGFAIGMERLVALLAGCAGVRREQPPQAYLVTVGELAGRQGLVLAERLRDRLPGLHLLLNCGGGSFKSQFKRADRSGAQVALILGETEVREGRIAVKFLREREEEQVDLPQEQLAAFLASRLALGQRSG
jgi:histidyl-tRNA synthetase